MLLFPDIVLDDVDVGSLSSPRNSRKANELFLLQELGVVQFQYVSTAKVLKFQKDIERTGVNLSVVFDQGDLAENDYAKWNVYAESQEDWNVFIEVWKDVSDAVIEFLDDVVENVVHENNDVATNVVDVAEGEATGGYAVEDV